MNFKWDWEKKELVTGEKPKGFEKLEGWEMVWLPGLMALGYYFIEHIAPWLGHLLFGGFL